MRGRMGFGSGVVGRGGGGWGAFSIPAPADWEVGDTAGWKPALQLSSRRLTGRGEFDRLRRS